MPPDRVQGFADYRRRDSVFQSQGQRCRQPGLASRGMARGPRWPQDGPPGSRSVRGGQLRTEGVVQFAAADLALERLVTAVEVLPLLGVDKASSPLRREELNAC